MYAPLSEHFENKLSETFCELHRVYSTCERPTHEWEEFKEDFAIFVVEQFKQEHKNMPPKDWR